MAYTGTIPDAGTSTEDESYIEQFRSNVTHLAQQKMSRLRNAVRNESCKGEYFNFERVGYVEAHEKTTRHALTPIMDTPHSRRKVAMKDFQWADLVDEEDKIRMLISPESEYTKSGAMAMGREFDRQIIAGAIGAATAGDGSSVAFDTANKRILHGSTGMTIAKLRTLKQNMDEDEVGEDGRFLALKAADLMDLLNTTEATSHDYNTVKALVRGELDTFMGYKFIRTELLTTATNVTSCIAWQKDCVGLAIGRDVIARTDPRPDVSYAQQVYLAFSAGATRIDDAGVVEVQTYHA